MLEPDEILSQKFPCKLPAEAVTGDQNNKNLEQIQRKNDKRRFV